MALPGNKIPLDALGTFIVPNNYNRRVYRVPEIKTLYSLACTLKSSESFYSAYCRQKPLFAGLCSVNLLALSSITHKDDSGLNKG